MNRNVVPVVDVLWAVLNVGSVNTCGRKKVIVFVCDNIPERKTSL